MPRRNSVARAGRRRFRSRSDKFDTPNYWMMTDDDGNPDTLVRYIERRPDDHVLVELPDGTTKERHLSRFFTPGGW